MPFCVYLNNQSVRQATLVPNGQKSSVTRYIFIEGRDLPIILLDDRYSVTPVINVEDGRNPRYNLPYVHEARVEVVISQPEGIENLMYIVSTSSNPGNELPL